MDIMTDLQNLPGIHRKYCNIYEEQPGRANLFFWRPFIQKINNQFKPVRCSTNRQKSCNLTIPQKLDIIDYRNERSIW